MSANQGSKAVGAAGVSFTVCLVASAAYTDHKIETLKEEFRELKSAVQTNNQNMFLLQNTIISGKRQKLVEIHFNEEKPKE
jgi:hypothetical protein